MRYGLAYDPDRHTSDAGLFVCERVLPPKRWGEWNGHDTITLAPGLTRVEYRSTLAHELAHAQLGHPASYCNHGHKDRCETRAWQLAATWLIDPTEYVDAERLDPSLSGIAWRLDVLPRVVEVWRTFRLIHPGLNIVAA